MQTKAVGEPHTPPSSLTRETDSLLDTVSSLILHSSHTALDMALHTGGYDGSRALVSGTWAFDMGFPDQRLESPALPKDSRKPNEYPEDENSGLKFLGRPWPRDNNKKTCTKR